MLCQLLDQLIRLDYSHLIISVSVLFHHRWHKRVRADPFFKLGETHGVPLIALLSGRRRRRRLFEKIEFYGGFSLFQNASCAFGTPIADYRGYPDATHCEKLIGPDKRVAGSHNAPSSGYSVCQELTPLVASLGAQSCRWRNACIGRTENHANRMYEGHFAVPSPELDGGGVMAYHKSSTGFCGLPAGFCGLPYFCPPSYPADIGLSCKILCVSKYQSLCDRAAPCCVVWRCFVWL
jgi:hypothetical protein